jgi:hypothetical protein
MRDPAGPGKRRAHVAGESDDRDGIRGVGEFRLRAQHEHRQPLLHGRGQFLRDEQANSIRDTPRQHRGEQPAFGGAVACEPCTRGIQVLNVVRELAVQKARRIVADGIDDAELVERHERATQENRVELGGGRLRRHSKRRGGGGNGGVRFVHGISD